MRSLAFPLALFAFITLSAGCSSDEGDGGVSDPGSRVLTVDELLAQVCQRAAACPDLSPTPDEIDACPAGIRSELSEDQLAELERIAAYASSHRDCILGCVGRVICGRFSGALAAISDADAVEPLQECDWECR